MCNHDTEDSGNEVQEVRTNAFASSLASLCSVSDDGFRGKAVSSSLMTRHRVLGLR